VLCVEGASPSLEAAQSALAPWPVDQLIALRRIPRDVRHHSKTDLPRLRQEIRKALLRA
jgi:hypothetical protein